MKTILAGLALSSLLWPVTGRAQEVQAPQCFEIDGKSYCENDQVIVNDKLFGMNAVQMTRIIGMNREGNAFRLRAGLVRGPSQMILMKDLAPGRSCTEAPGFRVCACDIVDTTASGSWQVVAGLTRAQQAALEIRDNVLAIQFANRGSVRSEGIASLQRALARPGTPYIKLTSGKASDWAEITGRPAGCFM